MSENIFDELIWNEKQHKKRTADRLQVMIPAYLILDGKAYETHVVDISNVAIRIDRNVSIAFQDSCKITLRTEPALQLECLPMINGKDFFEGRWCRLKIKSSFDFQKFVALLQKRI